MLRRVSAVIEDLTGCHQVYSCLWSHGAVHLHFVLQPVWPEAGRPVGPTLQAAMFEASELPSPPAVEEFCDRARAALAA